MSYILDYLELGASGKVNIPKRVIKQYEMLVPIIDGKHSRWCYNEKKAQRPIEFATRFCRYSKDKWRGQPVQYLPWQKAAVEAIYGIVDRETGVKKHRRNLVLCGKKNGKTTFVAPLALYETAKKGNEIYSAANAIDQSRIIWQEAVNMLKQSPQLRTMLRPMQYEIKNIRENGFSIFRPLANSPDVLDGKLPYVAILDEIHELSQALYDILYNGQISIDDALLMMLTTKGYVREGLFDSEYKNSCEIIDGIIEDERKFSLLYELDDPINWLNEDAWIQANPSLGTIIPLENLRDTVKTALQNPKGLNAVKTKHFNIGGISGDAYYEYDEINNEKTFEVEKFRNCLALGGFDLSLTNDMTAFSTLLWDAEEREWCVDVMYWVSSSFYEKVLQDKRMGSTWRVWVEKGYIEVAGKDTIDYTRIVDYVIMMAEKYGIIYKYIYYDPYSARYLITDLNNAGFKEGECLIRCRQGSQTLSVPFQQLDVEIKNKRINYNNNPVMKWNLTNVAVEEDKRNKNILPCKAGHANPRKIDGFATLLNAFVGAVEHRDELVY